MIYNSAPTFFEPLLDVPSGPPSTAQAEVISFVGVDYLRLRTGDGGDLYLTRFGLPFREQLAPENWYAPDWFGFRRARLPGTSAIYKVPTRQVRGISLNLVARFSRVGQEIPLDTVTLNENIHAEFNSPFEEFALVTELRTAGMGTSRPRIFTKRPLAIHVPAKPLEYWQTGRLKSKIAAKQARHPTVELDPLRQYILLYGWIEGLNAVQAIEALGVSGKLAETFLAETTIRAIDDLEQLGFRMLDIKPEHIVLRMRPDGSLLRRRSGNPAYALVDYELLERFTEGN